MCRVVTFDQLAPCSTSRKYEGMACGAARRYREAMNKLSTFLVLALACGGGNGGSDAGRDGSGDAAGDASVDAEVDGAVDGSDVDATIVDRLMGPTDAVPPETPGVEPGSDVDDLLRYCWYITRLFCEGHYACCEVEDDRRVGNDVDECTEGHHEALCSPYHDRPDTIGPQSRDELEAELDQIAEALDACVEPGWKIGIALGDVELGGDCTTESRNPNGLCEGRTNCVEGICTAPGEIGEPCVRGGYDCVPEGYCDEDDMCSARTSGEIGASCEGYYECESSVCEDGMCIEDPYDFWCLGVDRFP